MTQLKTVDLSKIYLKIDVNRIGDEGIKFFIEKYFCQLLRFFARKYDFSKATTT